MSTLRVLDSDPSIVFSTIPEVIPSTIQQAAAQTSQMEFPPSTTDDITHEAVTATRSEPSVAGMGPS